MPTTFADALDDFDLRFDPAGFTTCTTFPPQSWDRVECDGLSPAFEAGVRAAVPKESVIVGATVHRSEAWGFRVMVVRHPQLVGLLGDRDDAQLVELVKQKTHEHVPSATGIDARLVPQGDLHLVRAVYGVKLDEQPLSMIDYVVPAAHATYEVEFLTDDAHRALLEPIADRAMASVSVHPAPRKAQLAPFAIALGIFGVALLGTIVLVLQLVASRRRRPSAVSWPGVRDPEERR